MNILLINGSPRGAKSNSLKLARTFLEGFCETNPASDEPSIETVTVASLNIAPCKGCFGCWKNTPGLCCIKDDMQTVLTKIRNADLVVWSFPLYYFSVPGLLKNLIDRQLPLLLPFMSENIEGIGSGKHDHRYDMSHQRHVLVSTCGFYSAEKNYDSVTKMFDHFLGRGNYETVFSGQGELFSVEQLQPRTKEYLAFVKNAGAEYANGAITETTKAALKQLLYPKDVFERMADSSWGVSKTEGKKESDELIFTRQMAALYNKASYDGKLRVLEMHYTDTDSTYQILLGENGSEVHTDGTLTATTRIETPFEVWLAISRGEIGGAEALAKGMYTVQGDFSLMINWDKFFGFDGQTENGSSQQTKDSTTTSDTPKNPTMLTMLLPWTAFWIGVPIDVRVGSLVVLLLCATIPLIMRKVRFTLWDRLSLFAVGALACFASGTGQGSLAAIIGYLVFGLMWLGSCFTKEPLCAAYSKWDYGGDKAHANPLFMQTNRILAILWGTLYVLQAAWTFLLIDTTWASLVMTINSLVPCVMGVFTVWFIKWYPAWKARGR